MTNFPISTEFCDSVNAIVNELVTDNETARASGATASLRKEEAIYVIGKRLEIPEFVAAVLDAETGEWKPSEDAGNWYDGLALLGCFNDFTVGRGKTGIVRKGAEIAKKAEKVKLPSIVAREAAKAVKVTEVVLPVAPTTEFVELTD